MIRPGVTYTVDWVLKTSSINSVPVHLSVNSFTLTCSSVSFVTDIFIRPWIFFFNALAIYISSNLFARARACVCVCVCVAFSEDVRVQWCEALTQCTSAV